MCSVMVVIEVDRIMRIESRGQYVSNALTIYFQNFKSSDAVL